MKGISSCISLLMLLFVGRAFGQTETPLAQPASPVQNYQEQIFAGFEDGNYEGWTLTGDCWLPEPATSRSFVDPRIRQSLITGFAGKGFLISFKKNMSETGRAVSKEFTIDKPYISFRIGGGYYPGAACLNLVVEGKIAHSETGTDSYALRAAYWDVQALMGKKAHFEIVDATQSSRFGYVSVDDIRFFCDVRKLPVVTLRLQVIQVTDDDGSNAIPATREEIQQAVTYLNMAYRPANVQFVWNTATDFAVIHDSFLNKDFDPPGDTAPLTRPDQKPPEPNMLKRYDALDKASLAYSRKVPVYLIRGNEWKWSKEAGQWTVGTSNTSHGMPNFVFCRKADGGLWSHELGHLFGLVHTQNFSEPIGVSEDVIKAIQQNIQKGAPVKEAAGIFDFDLNFGISDTLPDPGQNFYNKYRPEKPFSITVPLPTGGQQEYRMNCINPMSNQLKDQVVTFSPDQCRVIRAKAESWAREGGRHPVNERPTGAQIIEMESLRFEGSNGVRMTQKQFRGTHGSQRFVEIKGAPNETYTIDIPISRSGRYSIRLFAACAIGYGQCSVSVNDVKFAEIDLWCVHWYAEKDPAPSGSFVLGTMTLPQGAARLAFTITGKHRQSSGYNLGLDALALIPIE